MGTCIDSMLMMICELDVSKVNLFVCFYDP